MSHAVCLPSRAAKRKRKCREAEESALVAATTTPGLNRINLLESARSRRSRLCLPGAPSSHPRSLWFAPGQDCPCVPRFLPPSELLHPVWLRRGFLLRERRSASSRASVEFSDHSEPPIRRVVRLLRRATRPASSVGPGNVHAKTVRRREGSIHLHRFCHDPVPAGDERREIRCRGAGYQELFLTDRSSDCRARCITLLSRAR